LNLKNLPTGPGDDLKIEGDYAKGLTKYVVATASVSPNFAMFGGSGRAYQSVGFGATTDAVFLPVLNGGTGFTSNAGKFGFRQNSRRLQGQLCFIALLMTKPSR